MSPLTKGTLKEFATSIKMLTLHQGQGLLREGVLHGKAPQAATDIGSDSGWRSLLVGAAWLGCGMGVRQSNHEPQFQTEPLPRPRDVTVIPTSPIMLKAVGRPAAVNKRRTIHGS